jgi:Peptidase family M28
VHRAGLSAREFGLSLGEDASVRLATYAMPPSARAEQWRSAVSPGLFWAQFGDTTLLYGDETRWEEVPADVRRHSVERREHPTSVQKEHLHLVVQNGRLFQQEHPHVPVILDRGRILLVELDADQAHQLAGKSPTCYGVLPLPENQVVFEVHAPALARTARVDEIEYLVSKVTRASLEANLTHLAAFPTRYSTSTHYANAATWAQNQLQALHYTTRWQTVMVNGSRSRNVIADKKGNAAGRHEVVLITAHLDSINLQGGPAAPAPGADDNGSGSAGLLEIARAFADHPIEHDLRFILFGGEEEGLFGSQRYVASLSASEKRRIRAVVNMDMIGTLNTSTRSVLLEGAPLSQQVINGLAAAAATYTQLTVETSLNPFASDHVPFINAGIQAVLTIEGTDNTNRNIHSSRDTIDHINSLIGKPLV